MKVLDFKDAYWCANAERKSPFFFSIFNTFSQNLSFGDLETSSKGHVSRPFNAPISNRD